jgi:hypothetical protein
MFFPKRTLTFAIGGRAMKEYGKWFHHRIMRSIMLGVYRMETLISRDNDRH